MSNTKESMQKCYLDANVLLYYKLEDTPKHRQTTSLIEKLSAEETTLYISSLVLDEFIYGFLKIHRIYKKKVGYDDIRRALKDVLSLPKLRLLNPSTAKKNQLRVLSLMEQFNLQPRDAYHLLIMLEHKIRLFASFDDDFRRVFKKGILKPV